MTAIRKTVALLDTIGLIRKNRQRGEYIVITVPAAPAAAHEPLDRLAVEWLSGSADAERCPRKPSKE